MFLPRSRRVATACFALALSLATQTRAAERDAPAAVAASPSAWSERPLSLHGVFSLPGGPLGLTGVELDYAPTSRVGLTAGVGTGFVPSGFEARYAVGARYRLVLGKNLAVSAGATFSSGRYTARRRTREWSPTDHMDLDHALWAGPQLAVEYRQGGLSVKLLSGAEVLLNGRTADCYRTEVYGPRQPISCSKYRPLAADSLFFAPVGVAIGYAF